MSIEYTQPEYIQLAYMSGHEIATHTAHHVGLPNLTEIVGARQWLNEVGAGPGHASVLPWPVRNTVTARLAAG